jgi:hypothetical protein
MEKVDRRYVCVYIYVYGRVPVPVNEVTERGHFLPLQTD